jgi:hypothetical protein
LVSDCCWSSVPCTSAWFVELSPWPLSDVRKTRSSKPRPMETQTSVDLGGDLAREVVGQDLGSRGCRSDHCCSRRERPTLKTKLAGKSSKDHQVLANGDR